MIRALTVLPLLLLTAAPALAQNPEAGAWTVTTTVERAEMPGAPPEMAAAMAGQSTATNYCLTPEQAAGGPRALFEQDGACSFETFEMDGESLEAVGTCTAPGAPGPMEVSITGSFSGASYTAASTVRIATPGGQMTIETSGVGERTGDC